MNSTQDPDLKASLVAIAAELRIIRKLLLAMLIGLAVLIGAMISAELTVLLVIVGIGLYLFITIVGTIFQRAQRRRVEAMRLRDLSGR